MEDGGGEEVEGEIDAGLGRTELHRNGGVQPVVHGAFNETSIGIPNVTHHQLRPPEMVAQKATKRGT